MIAFIVYNTIKWIELERKNQITKDDIERMKIYLAGSILILFTQIVAVFTSWRILICILFDSTKKEEDQNQIQQ